MRGKTIFVSFLCRIRHVRDRRKSTTRDEQPLMLVNAENPASGGNSVSVRSVE